MTPSEVTEGGRRIYHESDLERLQVICFLRDLDFSIKQIKKLLQEENREQVLELLLTDQIESLEKVFRGNRGQTKTCLSLAKATAKRRQLSLEDLSDISRLMENQKSWRHLQLRNVWECHSNLPSFICWAYWLSFIILRIPEVCLLSVRHF